MKFEMNLKNVVIILIILLLICINIILYIKNSDFNKNNTLKVNTVESNKISEVANRQEDIMEKLQSMGERDRMEFYFSEYATYIEDGEYEKAYDLLYPDFKTNYFPTLEQFEEYAKKTYPEFMTFSYNNIERQGYIYVLNIDIIDVDNKENKKSHRIVIQENDFNDFVLSFQVI